MGVYWLNGVIIFVISYLKVAGCGCQPSLRSYRLQSKPEICKPATSNLNLKMKGINKHKRILILMITSQVLLTLFILHWLRSQYRSEKESLVNELTEYYIETQDEVIDTLLFKTYVSPVLSMNGQVKTQHFITLKDSAVHDSVFLRTPESEEEMIKWKGSGEAITIRVEQDRDSGASLPDSVKIRKLNEDILLRSVRMIVSHKKDSFGNEERVIDHITMKPDTAIFKVHFNERLARAGMNFNFAWGINNKSAIIKQQKKTIYLNLLNPFSLPAISVTHYNKYLAGKIFPQMLFGLTLIFVTALAFWLSYRSIRDHVVMNSLRNEFISNISHELKTPVATLSVALESLRKFNMKDEPSIMEEYLNLAALETKRLEELISRVLDHSILEENNYQLNFSAIDISQLISEVTDIMKPGPGADGAIEFLPTKEKISIMGDPLFLKGVLINLVDNSIKYCDKVPVIRILAGKNDGFALIEVVDNGPGIPAEYQKKIFEKFFRLPSGNIHNVKGYGLGLSFASLVMKMHKGSISVRNNEQGCSFILKIPAI